MYYHTEVLVCIYPIKYSVVDAAIVWGCSIFPFVGDIIALHLPMFRASCHF